MLSPRNSSVSLSTTGWLLGDSFANEEWVIARSRRLLSTNAYPSAPSKAVIHSPAGSFIPPMLANIHPELRSAAW